MKNHNEALCAQLREILGSEFVIDDEAELEYYSGDVYAAGVTAMLVIVPQDRQALAAAVGAITAAGVAVVPRGGGMSYTGGYTPIISETVIVDTGALDAIVEVNADDMYITVEAGVTWEQIYTALDPLGLRLPFFGTFSGSRATVGGGLSNGALFLGTARYGTAAEIVLSLEVVAASGRVIKTGQPAFHNGKPFYRTYGPDLTGLFVHDSGALGIKSLISMRLIEKPAETDYASFVFSNIEDTVAALSALARSDAIEEVFVLDPEATRRGLGASDLKKDVKRLFGVVKGQSSLAKGLRDGLKLVSAGRNFVGDDLFSLHVVCAGRNVAAVAADLQCCRQIVERQNGAEIANSIPKAARGNPFEPLNSILGAHGDRWAAVNSKVAHSDAQAIIDATDAIISSYADRMKACNVTHSRLCIAISNHAFSFEPVLRWYDEWLPIHRRTPEPQHLQKLDEPAANPEARKLVGEIRQEIVALFAEFGAASNQIGKTYPYFQSLNDDTAALIAALKTNLDPNGLMNPGALGLPREESQS